MMQNSPSDELNFLDSSADVHQSTKESYKDSSVVEVEREGLLDDTTESLISAQPSFWSFEYYQQFFDVNTDQVLSRMLSSFIPRVGTSFIQQQLKSAQPDLWGPTWVCITLVFTVAIAGNAHNYLMTAAQDADKWSYDFRFVSASAGAIFTYAWLVPVALWAFLWWRKAAPPFSCLELLCLYGYSLSIFVPISILWIVPYFIFQWIMIAIGGLLSGTVLLFAVWPVVKNDSKLVLLATVVVIVGLHAALAIGFKLYFFTPATASISRVNLPEVATTVASSGRGALKQLASNLTSRGLASAKTLLKA